MLLRRTNVPNPSGSSCCGCPGGTMQQNTDLIDLLRALNAEGAEYLIVGAYAFAFHGRARATSDVDLFVGSDPANAQRIWRALVAFGAPLADLSLSDLASPGVFYIMGRPPNQIDLITTIDGVTFEQAWVTRVESSYGGVPVSYIGREELIANKKAAARPQDLADVSYLEGADNLKSN
jgi:predicted nucleotidyltransferase